MLCFFFLSAGKCGFFFDEYGTYCPNAKRPLGNDCQFYTSNQHSSPDSLTKEVVCQVTQEKSVLPLCQELSEEFCRVQRNETIGL